MKRLFSTLITLAIAASAALASETTDGRLVRNYITDGNRLYRQDRFADAEVLYKKALEINPNDETALFNLAASYLRQGSADGQNMKEAVTILGNLTQHPIDEHIAELASYNLGNIAFGNSDYSQAIAHYKNALRRNPSNDLARQNLRLAQKKLQEQQQNQDQNQDQQQQDQQDQQNQDQQQQQNQQQNQDQNQDKNQDQNQQQNQQQQQQQNQQQQQQQQQQQGGGISRDNADKILNTVANEENATRQRVNAERQKGGAPQRRQVTKPW